MAQDMDLDDLIEAGSKPHAFRHSFITMPNPATVVNPNWELWLRNDVLSALFGTSSDAIQTRCIKECQYDDLNNFALESTDLGMLILCLPSERGGEITFDFLQRNTIKFATALPFALTAIFWYRDVEFKLLPVQESSQKFIVYKLSRNDSCQVLSPITRDQLEEGLRARMTQDPQRPYIFRPGQRITDETRTEASKDARIRTIRELPSLGKEFHLFLAPVVKELTWPAYEPEYYSAPDEPTTVYYTMKVEHFDRVEVDDDENYEGIGLLDTCQIQFNEGFIPEFPVRARDEEETTPSDRKYHGSFVEIWFEYYAILIPETYLVSFLCPWNGESEALAFLDQLKRGKQLELASKICTECLLNNQFANRRHGESWFKASIPTAYRINLQMLIPQKRLSELDPLTAKAIGENFPFSDTWDLDQTCWQAVRMVNRPLWTCFINLKALCTGLQNQTVSNRVDNIFIKHFCALLIDDDLKVTDFCVKLICHELGDEKNEDSALIRREIECQYSSIDLPLMNYKYSCDLESMTGIILVMCLRRCFKRCVSRFGRLDWEPSRIPIKERSFVIGNKRVVVIKDREEAAEELATKLQQNAQTESQEPSDAPVSDLAQVVSSAGGSTKRPRSHSLGSDVDENLHKMARDTM